MIYIISGASRSGKSITARKLFERNNIPYVPVDSLMMGFMNGLPSLGIHDKLWPNEIAGKMWEFLKATCENMIYNELNYILEGEAFLPHLIRPFMDKYPEQIKACFFGYGDADEKEKISNVIRFPNHENDWLVNLDEESIASHIGNMKEYSQMLQRECTEHSIRYFDTSLCFSETIEEAIRFLIT